MNVYDFDETIYDGESSIEFLFCYLREDPSVVRFLPSVAKLMFRYNRGKATFEDFTRDYAPALRDYFARNDVDLMKLVSGFWDKRMHKIKPFYHEQQRPDDVIITASPYFMMNDICARLGVRHLIATDFDIETGEIRTPCFRERKVDLFRAAFPGQEIDDFYTDSVNDSFLFPLAKRVFMVKGDKISQIK